MTMLVMLYIISAIEWFHLTKGSAFFPIMEAAAPNSMAKNIICNILPSTMEANGLSGTMLTKVSSRLGGSVATTFFPRSIETPSPGLIILPITSPTMMAKNVVKT